MVSHDKLCRKFLSAVAFTFASALCFGEDTSPAMDYQLPTSEIIRKVYVLEQGNLVHAASSNDSSQWIGKLYWDSGAKGLLAPLVDDGFYHEILAVSDGAGRIVLTFETAEREALLHTRRPSPSERFVALVEPHSGRRYRIATLSAWGSVRAMFSPDGGTVAVLGQVADSLSPKLGTWTMNNKKLEFFQCEPFEISDFVSFNDGRVAFAGAIYINNELIYGVFDAAPGDAQPLTLESGLAVEKDSMTVDPVTGKVKYRLAAPIGTQSAFADGARASAEGLRFIETGSGTEVRDGANVIAVLPSGQVPRWAGKVANGTMMLVRDKDSDFLVLKTGSAEAAKIHDPNRYLDAVAFHEQSGRLLMVSKPPDIELRRLNSKSTADWGQRLIVFNPMDQSVDDFGAFSWSRVHSAAWSKDGSAFFVSFDGIYRGKIGEATLHEFIPAVTATAMVSPSPDTVIFTSVNVRKADGTLSRGLFVAKDADSIRLLDPAAAGATIIEANDAEVVYSVAAAEGPETKALGIR